MSNPALLTTADCAARYGGTVRLWRKRCEDGRIAGAAKIGRDWLIPAAVAAAYAAPVTGRPRDPEPSPAALYRRRYRERRRENGA